MTNVKEKFGTKLHILEILTDWSDIVSIDKLKDIDKVQYSIDTDIILVEQCMKELFVGGYIRNTIPTKLERFYSDDKYELTSRGADFAEHVSCRERWDKVFAICEQIKDYSEDTSLYVYEQLLKKEIACLI